MHLRRILRSRENSRKEAKKWPLAEQVDLDLAAQLRRRPGISRTLGRVHEGIERPTFLCFLVRRIAR